MHKHLSFFFTALIAVSVLAISSVTKAQTLSGRDQILLDSGSATVAFDVAGGAMVDFHLAGGSINPFTWNYPGSPNTKPRPMGHFICFDRWGQPSDAEGKNGMPFHGEATSVVWSVDQRPKRFGNTVNAVISCTLPIGGMTLSRHLTLHDSAPVLEVSETITNINPLGRIYNIVQHPSIAPPFLDESTIVDCNASHGYMQESRIPGEPIIYWPDIAYNGSLIDYRRLAGDSAPAVVSFVFRDDIAIGWVTACNPAKGLLVGYIWRTAEYPWLNLWRNVIDGRPAARGLEFGTTGLHKPFKDMIELGSTLFGRKLFEYLDADESVTKSYVVFELPVADDYKGIGEVMFSDGIITVRERETGRVDTIRY